MTKIQDWWGQKRPKVGTRKKMGSDVVVQKALGLVLMTRHELWKSRSRQVIAK